MPSRATLQAFADAVESNDHVGAILRFYAPDARTRENDNAPRAGREALAEREMLQAAIDHSQQYVTGRVRLKLYKGNAIVIGRESKYSLYDQDLVTFEEGAVAYDHRDAAGFIKLNALRLRTLGQRRKKLGL